LAQLLFNWLRLFENTSFFVTLIQETFYDIRYFILILAATFSFFGAAMYMLQLNSKAGAGGDQSVINLDD